MVSIITRLHLSLLLLSLLVLGGCAGPLRQSGAGVPVIDGTGNPLPQQQEQQSSGVPQQPSAIPYRVPGPFPTPQSQPQPIIGQSSSASSPAVMSLLDNAEKERSAGRLDHAAAAIERAVGLEPQNALLWSRLAAIRMDQNNWQQANVLASRSNSLARNNRALQVQNWRIIAQARARLGDSAGAAAARQMILRLGEGNY